MKVQNTLLALSLLGACAFACGTTSETGSEVDEAVKKAGTKAALDTPTKNTLYHLSEGSEIFPYFAVRALEVPLPDGRYVKFLDPENLKQYGLLPDEKSTAQGADGTQANPEGLPVGLTLTHAKDTGFISLGVNCSVCHVGEIEYKTKSGALKKLRVDGAPNVFDIQGFYGGIIRGLKASLDKSTVEARLNRDKFLVRAGLEGRYVRDNLYKVYGDDGQSGFLDNIERFVEQTEIVLKLAELASNPPATIEEVEQVIDGLPNTTEPQRRLLLARFYFFKNLLNRLPSTRGGFGRTDAFGTAKNSLFGHLGFQKPTNAQVSYPSMFNMETELWFHYNSNTTSVIERNIGQSLGLGAVADTYDKKTGPEEKRAPTFITTSKVANLYQLEQAIYKIAPPVYPSDGIRDEGKVTRGKTVYLENCQGCHEPTPLDTELNPVALDKAKLFASAEIPLEEMGVDGNQANNFDLPVLDKPLSERIGGILDKLKTTYYATEGTPEKVQALWENRFDAKLNPTGLRGTAIWRNSPVQDGKKLIRSKPLDGVWSTGPFLHNGSVPTIADLLKPASERPKKFRVGHRLFDAKNVGYLVLDENGNAVDSAAAAVYTQAELARAKAEATFLFDTSPTDEANNNPSTGNANVGHEFGTDLSADDKTALLEFLKGFGGGANRPVVYGKK
ncbi:MAG: di-heme-cytochrome C peroxidase [Polyangiaceae bacterium]